MSDTTEQLVCEHLEKHLFDRIWNEPYKEYRTNVRPRLLTAKAVCGTYKPRINYILGTRESEQLVADYTSTFIGSNPWLPLNQQEQISLPTLKDLYYVYAVPAEEAAPFQLNVPNWVKMSDYCKHNLLDLQLYTKSGIWLWREGIYIRTGNINNAILVAVRRDVYKKCCGSYNPADVYFTKYHDSDLEQSVTCKYVKIAAQSELFSTFTMMSGATMTFVNGKYSNIAYPSNLKVGDLVEGIFDDNVISEIVIDMQNKRNLTYVSDGSSVKTIIHIPRDCNPAGHLITHNTCDICVLPKNTSDTSGATIPRRNGRFVHKCLREDQFFQLTHNDFSVKDSLIGEIAEDVGASQYEIHVFIRSHNKKLGLVRDVNYCDLLYTHNDETILKFMLGQGPASFDFWTADALEDSVYANTAIMGKTGHRPDRDLGYFVDVLGYYNTIQLICERVIHYKVGINADRSFTVPIPLVFNTYSVNDMFCIVYHNGIKIDDSQITYLANTTGSSTNTEITQSVVGREWDGTTYTQLSYLRDVKTFAIELSDEITLKPDDIVVIEVFENPAIRSELRTIHDYQLAGGTFQANVVYYTSSVDRLGNTIYREADITAEMIGTVIPVDTYYTNHNRDVVFNTAHPLIYKQGLGCITKDADGNIIKDANDNPILGNSYKLLDNPGEWNLNTNTLTLSSSLIGTSLLLTENIGINRVFYDNAWMVEQSSWRAISTGSVDASTNNGVGSIELPLVGDVTFLVFLNGRCLSEDLDYVIYTTKVGNDLVRRELIIQNLTWLKQSNRIEVYAVRAAVRGYTKGYVSGSQVTNVGESPFWFDHLSVLTVDGSVISNFDSFFGQIFVKSTGHRNGASYLQRSLIPNTAVELIEKYRTDTDLVRLTRLRDYFLGANEDPIERVVVPHSHAIFSIYLNSIVRDFLSGNLTFDMHADEVIFKDQFAAYEWLKSIDAAYKKQDLRYLDIYPMYHRTTTNTTLTYRKLKYLFKMLLPKDSVQYKDVINE